MENTAKVVSSRAAGASQGRPVSPLPLRLTIWLAVFTILAFLVGGCSSNVENKKAESSVKDLTENVTQQVESFTLSSVGDDGQSNWELEGESADIVEDKINLKNVNIKSRSKDASLTMKAKQGVIKKSEDKGIFKEDVVLAYDDGTTLSTDEIDWSFKKQTAKAAGPVFVKSGQMQTQADGALLKKEMNQIQLNKNILMKTGSGTTIKCSGPLVLDYKKNVAFFNKDVRIENPKGIMTSDKMVVFFDPQKKKVSRVQATGGVKLLRGNSVSMSEKAVYFAEDGRAILTGNPVVFVDQEEARKASKEL